MSHVESTLCNERRRRDDWIVLEEWREGGLEGRRGGEGRQATPPQGAPWCKKDRVTDIYQQSVHRGSPAPLTITAQHLATTKKET